MIFLHVEINVSHLIPVIMQKFIPRTRTIKFKFMAKNNLGISLFLIKAQFYSISMSDTSKDKH